MSSVFSGMNMRPVVSPVGFAASRWDMTPAFAFIGGCLLHSVGLDFVHERQLFFVGETCTYRKHGKFVVDCIGADYAVIRHTPFYSQKPKIILIRENHWVNVSNGTFESRPIAWLWSELSAHCATMAAMDRAQG